MSGWNKISLLKFQQINTIANKKELSDEDKLIYQVCAFYDMTFFEFDNMEPKKAARLINDLTKKIIDKFEPAAYEKIGEYFVNYYPEDMTLGQYVEVMFYLSDIIGNAHKVLASITNMEGEPNISDDHAIKSQYFLLKSVNETLGCVRYFKTRFENFNNRFKLLFGTNTDEGQEIETDPFFKRYGWVFSATQVAEHNKITLDQAYALPIIQAFNDLGYLKSRAAFEERQTKKLKRA